MLLDKLVTSIKEHEGFVNHVYKDSLGYDTIGYGTLLPITQLEATLILRSRLNSKIKELNERQPIYKTLPEEAQAIVAGMAYQLGVTGLLKFKKTWGYLEDHEFKKASVEMLSSLWAAQTPNRAKELSIRMAKLEEE